MDRPGRKYVEEIVEDSEPEREELRRREKKERRLKRKRDLKIIDLTGSLSDTADTPESRVVAKKYSPKVPPPNHVDIVRTESEHSSALQTSDDITQVSSPPNRQAIHPELPVNNDISSPVATILRPASFIPPVATLSMSKDSGNEEDELGMDLARFAYNNHSFTAPQSRGGPSRATTVEGTWCPVINRKSVRRTSHRPTVDMSDAVVARLMKCISCNLKWTARKTAAEKMKHVQSCAKRNSLTDETVRVLIRQELDKAPTDAKGKSKGEIEPSKEANTVLEDVLNDHAPKKKGKRAEVLKTVKSLTETRHVILDRARTILGNADDVDFSIQTQVFGPSKLVNGLPGSDGVGIFPPTQPFEKSTLGQAQTIMRPKPIIAAVASTSARAGVVSGSEHSNSDIDMTSPNQESAPSKLLYGVAEFVPNCSLPSAVLPQPSVVNLSSSSLIEYFPPPVAPFTDIASSEHSPCPPLSNETSVALPYDHSLHELQRTPDLTPTGNEGPGTPIDVYDEFAWENEDDAYLHFDPNVDAHNQQGPILFPNDSTSHEQRHSDFIPSCTCPEESAKNKQATTQNKIKAKSKHRKGESDEPQNEALGDNWEIKMKDIIIEDKILHHRILRYEPIHFNVLFQLAVEQGLPPHGLGVKLRSFLDKLAVKFYGADPTGRRH